MIVGGFCSSVNFLVTKRLKSTDSHQNSRLHGEPTTIAGSAGADLWLLCSTYVTDIIIITQGLGENSSIFVLFLPYQGCSL